MYMCLKALKMKNYTLDRQTIWVEDFPNTTTEQSNLPNLADPLNCVIMRRMLQKEMREAENFLSKKMGKHSGNSKDGFREVFYEMKGVGV